MTKLLRKDITVLVLIIILFSLYAAVFIYRTSFVIDGERYFSLFDDAMVSMHYAKNLVEGNGLVMNAGERVEGYTNPLWVFYMSAVHLLPVPQSKISLIIQITGAILLIINLVFVRKIALIISGNSRTVSSIALLLTAFYLPLINWSLQGMETGLQVLVLSIAVWRALVSYRMKTCPWGVYLLLGMSTLIRLDMVVPFIGIWMFFIVTVPRHRTKNLLWGGLILVFFLGGQTIFRIMYYGDPLPNTYYLKMIGYPVFLRITRGFIVWWKFIWDMNLLLFLIPVAALILSYNHLRGILALVIGLQMLYSIYVGGDAWEALGGSNRYIAVIMPQFFILLAYGISLIKPIIVGINKKTGDFRKKAYGFIIKHHIIILILLSFIEFNNNNNALSLSGFMMIHPPLYIDSNRNMVESALIIKNITNPDARAAVTWAGAFPYFSERYTVDLLGKTDKTIAHEKMRTASGWQKFTYFYPGHLKYDYRYSINNLKPDVVFQYWGDMQEYAPYLSDGYSKVQVNDKVFFFRNGSKNIRWSTFMKDTPLKPPQ